ncbi:ABC transporter permease subunit, partial [Microbacterium sp.]|nr:ABC transporter permease [Microbacterium sp.]
MTVTAEPVVSDEQRRVTVVSWKAPVIFAIFTVLFALLPLLAPREGETTFRLSAGEAFFTVPDVVLPATATAWIAVVLLAAATVFAVIRVRARRGIPLWLVIVWVAVLMIGFLAWAAAGSTLPMIGLLGGALALATPLIFGALGGVIGERAGVVNIAIEAQLLAGAFSAAVAASLAGTPWAGLVAAMVAGMLVALVLGVFTITYFVDQVIVGVVLNVLVIGLTTFLF